MMSIKTDKKRGIKFHIFHAVNFSYERYDQILLKAIALDLDADYTNIENQLEETDKNFR